MIIILFFFGLILGSFINAFEWRFSKKIDHEGNFKKLSLKKSQDYSIIKGRSMCPHCRHVLSVSDLVPVFSWVMLGGKCRYCKKKISHQYPLIELSTSILFVVSYLFWPLSLNSIGNIIQFSNWLCLLCGFIILILFDFKRFLLPSKIIYTLIFLTAVSILLRFLISKDTAIVLIPFFSSLIFFGIFLCISLFSKGAWIGGGDVRLALLLGLQFTNPIFVFLTLFIASVSGLAFIVPALISKKQTVMGRIPFGPFLILGTFVSILFGESFIKWYLTLLN